MYTDRGISSILNLYYLLLEINKIGEIPSNIVMLLRNMGINNKRIG
jgi:hypothetical protein